MDRYSKGVRMALGRAGIIRYPGPSLFAAFTIGAGVGLLAGACVAMLSAPTTGREMRSELGGRAKRLAGRTQEVFTEAAHGLKARISRAEERLQQERNEVPIG